MSPYGAPGDRYLDFQHSSPSTLPFAETIAALKREIELAGLWVLHEIDPQKILRRGGHAIGAARQLLFFHPDLMIRLLHADRTALLEAPLKFAVMELPEGLVMVNWFDPALAFGRYDNPALGALGTELALVVERVVAAALAPGHGEQGR